MYWVRSGLGVTLLLLLLVAAYQVWQRADGSQVAEAVDSASEEAPRSRTPAMRHTLSSSSAALRSSLVDSSHAPDYWDPVGGGRVPLMSIRERLDDSLSQHFRMSDLVPDGVDSARVAPALVSGLEVLIWLANAPIYVSSGYRDPLTNAHPAIGGAPRSQHLAGRAVDVWSPEKTPGELAELALEAWECTIGIGLGSTFLHVDLRGYLASWSQEDAALDEVSFDAWVEARCASHVGEAPSFAEAVQASQDRAEEAARVRRDSTLASNRADMIELARVYQSRGTRGAVVLDLTTPSGMAVPRLSFLTVDSSLFAGSLRQFIRSIDSTKYFAYVVIDGMDEPVVGAMSYAPLQYE